MSRLSKLQILQLAKQAVQYEIGSHPAPLQFPGDITELEKDLEFLNAEIARASQPVWPFPTGRRE